MRGKGSLNNNPAGGGHGLFAHLLADAGQLRDIIEAVDRRVIVLSGLLKDLEQIGVVLLVDDKVRDGRFDLKGRRAIGSLPTPAYESNDAQGIVIVEITVDAAGCVQSAAFKPQGSTTQDTRLLDAALKAARQARFTASEANAVQTGTITYEFRLR